MNLVYSVLITIVITITITTIITTITTTTKLDPLLGDRKNHFPQCFHGTDLRLPTPCRSPLFTTSVPFSAPSMLVVSLCACFRSYVLEKKIFSTDQSFGNSRISTETCGGTSKRHPPMCCAVVVALSSPTEQTHSDVLAPKFSQSSLLPKKERRAAAAHRRRPALAEQSVFQDE